MTLEIEGIRQRERPKKTWWDCIKVDMESLGLSQKDHSSGINGEGESRGQLADLGSPGKWPLKWCLHAATVVKVINCEVTYRPTSWLASGFSVQNCIRVLGVPLPMCINTS